MKKYLFLPLLALALVACDEDGNSDQNINPANAPDVQVPEIVSDADAVLVAIKTSTTTEQPVVGSITIVSGVAVANFPDGNGGLNAAGMVTCNGSELQNNNNSYAFIPSASEPNGIDLDGNVVWGVEGSAEVAAFTETYTREVPQIGTVGGAESEITLSNGLTISIDPGETNTNISEADSLLFAVYDAEGNFILKTQAKSNTSATFSGSELSALSAGGGYVQANAYNFEVRTVNGSKVVFVNQGSTTIPTTWK